MIAALALLAALAAGTAPPPPTVWVAADVGAQTTAAQLTGELRGLGCAVVAAAPDAIASSLLASAPGTRRAVVLLWAAPAPAEIWWADERDQPAHEVVPPAAPSEWTRLDAIRVAETVRARVSPLLATPTVTPAPAEIVAPVAATIAPATADPFVRVAAGPSIAGIGNVGAAGAIHLVSSLAVRDRMRLALALTLPLHEVDWSANNGTALTRDTILAAMLERAFPLRAWGPGRFEARAAAGLALRRRYSRGTTYQSGYAFTGDETTYSGGPTLSGALAYRLRDRYALVVTAGGSATFPESNLVVDGYSLWSPGRFNWSLGLMAEVGVWLHPPH